MALLVYRHPFLSPDVQALRHLTLNFLQLIFTYYFNSSNKWGYYRRTKLNINGSIRQKIIY
uniref:Uncharacterized protein n=1 Tax=Arundo donax TaxID=35708 RepID=A0A0A9EP61_ARUDO